MFGFYLFIGICGPPQPRYGSFIIFIFISRKEKKKEETSKQLPGRLLVGRTPPAAYDTTVEAIISGLRVAIVAALTFQSIGPSFFYVTFLS